MKFASLLTQQKEQEAKQSDKTLESKHRELIFQFTSSTGPSKASTQILVSLSTMILSDGHR
jgi:bisphosphoglycerate-dependent phosphoglycerate mutase